MIVSDEMVVKGLAAHAQNLINQPALLKNPQLAMRAALEAALSGFGHVATVNSTPGFALDVYAASALHPGTKLYAAVPPPQTKEG